MKRILSIFLVIILSLSTLGLFACSPTSGFTAGELPEVDGTHEIEVGETNKKFIENGKSEYVIVIPKQATAQESLAAQEIAVLVKEASGVTLSTVTDEQISYNENSKIISLGDTTAFASAGISIDKEQLGVSGVRVQTKDNSVFINGGKFGTLYGAYEFLKWQLGFEFYAEATYDLDRGVSDKNLVDLNIVDVPDFQYINTGWFFVTKGANNTRKRYRMVDYINDLFIPINGKSIHNTFNYLPKAVYLNDPTLDTYHPKWFSDDELQLCYTAHGDEEEREEMVEEVARIIKDHLALFPDRDLISFSMEDTQTSCQCKACLDIFNHYNKSNVASVILFINDVKRNIDAWFEGEGADQKRDLKIYFLAYHALRTPPVTYDKATDTYSPIDDDIICEQGVLPWFAETLGDYTVDFYADINKDYAEDARAWSCLAGDDKFFWSYQHGMNHNFIPYNSFNQMKGIYTFAKNNGYSMMFDQAAVTSAGRLPGWCNLKAYLNSKIGWDISLNMEEQIEKFFKGYFGPASDIMLKWFNNYRAHAAVLETEEFGFNGSRSIFFNSLRADFWPKGLLNDWIKMGNEALAEVEKIKDSEPERYKILNANIRLEMISPYYLMAMLHSSSLSDDTLQDYKYKVCSYASEFGIDYIAEHSTISGLFTEWGYV